MRLAYSFAALGLASSASAGPCPFHTLRDAAAAGKLSAREAQIVDKMARDPTYIPTLDPEAAALMKREAAPVPKVNAAPLLKERQLPIIGGGLRKCTMNMDWDG